MELLRLCPLQLTRIIVGNDNLREFTAAVIPLRQVIDTGHSSNRISRIQLPDKFTVVITDHPFSFCLSQRIPKSGMILPAEYYRIMSFCFVIRRVTIEKGAFPVVLPDQRLKILILYYRISKPV